MRAKPRAKPCIMYKTGLMDVILNNDILLKLIWTETQNNKGVLEFTNLKTFYALINCYLPFIYESRKFVRVI